MTTAVELEAMTDDALEAALAGRGVAPGAVAFMVAHRTDSAWQPAVLAALQAPVVPGIVALGSLLAQLPPQLLAQVQSQVGRALGAIDDLL